MAGFIARVLDAINVHPELLVLVLMWFAAMTMNAAHWPESDTTKQILAAILGFITGQAVRKSTN